MTPAALAVLVRTVAHEVLADHGLHGAVLPDTVTVERPRHREHGDYATAVALQTTGVASREFAGWLAEALPAAGAVNSAEATGPGFVNLRLATGVQTEIVDEVLAAGDRYGLAGAPERLDPLRVSARTAAGTVMTMPQLVDALGLDAARYALIRCRPGARIDVARWSRRIDDNPLFVVQYAHSRLASTGRNAIDLGVTADGADPGLLRDEREGELIRVLGEFGGVVASAAQRREPHRVARYLEQVATAHYEFSDHCRVLPMGDEQPGPLHAARLALCHATRQVLANGLRLLGVDAPERM